MKKFGKLFTLSLMLLLAISQVVHAASSNYSSTALGDDYYEILHDWDFNKGSTASISGYQQEYYDGGSIGVRYRTYAVGQTGGYTTDEVYIGGKYTSSSPFYHVLEDLPVDWWIMLQGKTTTTNGFATVGGTVLYSI